MSKYSTEELSAMVEPTRYHRKLFVDEDIFDLEMERIYGRAWIYIGHESQVKNPGDYVTTRIGVKNPVVMVRDGNGKDIHVLHNRCGHKGATVVNRECGNVTRFRCNFHGWTFRTDGKLVGTPHATGYQDCGFDRNNPQYNMPGVSRQGEYRGFIFASLSEEGPELETFLGEVKSSFDNMVERSPEGRLELVGKGFRYVKNSNWKAFMDNLDDAMHPMVTHQSVGEACEDYLREMGEVSDPKLKKIVEILNPFISSYEFFDEMGVTTCAYGNGWTGGESSIHSEYDEIPGYRQLLVEAYGKEKARRILSVNRHNTIVYPCMTLKGAIQNIRVVRPVSVNKSIIESYSFRPVGAPEELLQRNILYSNLVNSPASLVGNDDAEMYERLQLGLQDEAGDWMDTHRYLNRDKEVKPGVFTAPGTSDLSFRNMYKAWKEYMMQEAA